MMFRSTRFRVIVSTADAVLMRVVDGVTLHGVPSSWQLKVKSLEIPLPSAPEAVDLRPAPADSIWIAARMKLGAPGANLDLLVFSFQVPTKGSVTANRDKATAHRIVSLAVFIGS